MLKPGGHFVAKVFRGGTEGELLARLKRDFASVHHVKPPASRAESVELYLVAKAFAAAESAALAHDRHRSGAAAGRARHLVAGVRRAACKNGIDRGAAISTPTTTKAGQNDVAVIAPPLSVVDELQRRSRRSVMPSDSEICCATLVSVVAWLICAVRRRRRRTAR